MSELADILAIKGAPKTMAAIEAAVVARAGDGLRPHLGASQIGKPCERELWFTFRWAKRADFDGRMLRLFRRGQREEEEFAGLLRDIGCQVYASDHDGRQWTFHRGHFGGSMDGAVIGLPDAPKKWHVVEMKTHGASSFNRLEKLGVAAAKPEHCAQMQCYMAMTGMTRALYMAVCKDDDRLHLERIDFDEAEAARLMAKAARIIAAPAPPPGVSERADWWECKRCVYSGCCHDEDVPLPTCRSCAHVTPTADGQWLCERHGHALDVPAQKAACHEHRYIPALLARFAEAVEADPEANWVRYTHMDTGRSFTNGRPPSGLESAEIHAAADKGTLAANETSERQ